jgi:NAD(P)-dependent dehydrogenase (short-subunit alcohol dehydrogenase family)
LDRVADDPLDPGRAGLVDRVTRTMPLRKVAEPEDVARQIVVLASDELRATLPARS